MPTDKVLSACWDANPHGAGLAFVDKSSVQVDKGHLDKKEFLRLVKDYRFTKDDEVAIHFRWATSGGINEGACHPFPISKQVGRLKQSFINAKEVLFHNGVFSIEPADGLSDTMTLVKRHLAQKGSRTPQGMLAIEKYRSGSRVLLFKAHDMKRIGDWHKIDGLWYSNLNFKRRMINDVIKKHKKANVRAKYPASDRPWKSTRRVLDDEFNNTVNIFDYYDTH
jgi:hypothetical protein